MIAAMKQKYMGGYTRNILCDYWTFGSKFRVRSSASISLWGDFPILPIALWNQGFVSSILPTMALAISPIADSARFVRTEMVEVLHSDYIELARAEGLNRFEVAFKHGFRNAIIPLVTILGPMLVGLVTGSMVIENIFAIPGIGEQFVKSILTNDYPTIMEVTMLYSALLVFVILIVDLLYGWIDPRIRITDEGGKRNGRINRKELFQRVDLTHSADR